LALQFHPDKNSAPGADEAFKLVSHAFTVLNDADKRAHYDRFGEDSRVPSSGAQFRRQPGFAARGPMEFEDEISPEELFNMFFGTMGGGFGGGTYRVRQFGGGNPFFTFQNATRQQYQQRQAQEGRDHAQHGLLSACIQFLPLIVLVALFLVSNFFSAFTDIDSTPSYSFSQQGPFNQHRVTLHYKVPYWVNSDEFAQSNVARRPSLVRQFEKDIETHYISHLHQSCQQEMMRKRRLVHNARGWFGLAKDKDKMREAERMPMPACEELKRFRSEH
ncbi:Chaperone protein dnaJ, partial [Spiromyces aspiralis]